MSSFSSNPLPTLFLLEASLNILSGAAFLLYPAPILRLVTHPSLTYPLTPTTTVSETSVQLFQWLAALAIALSAPLILGARDTDRARASRRLVYETLGAGEVCLVSVMLWQLQKGQVEGGITGRTLVGGIAVLGSAVLGRAYAMVFKQEWFGVGVVASEGKRK